MAISKEMQKEIRTLVRRANRRIERAKGGQKTYLESIVSGGKFSAATKGMSQTQAQALLNRLNKFLGSMSTTRVGWDWIKQEIVHKSGTTLRSKDYTITDAELAEILMQIDSSDKKEFYRAINLVEAAKQSDENWGGTAKEIADAIAEKVSAQEALNRVIQIRDANSKA